ncbi:hypothetical protein [Deinococcus cellulosilyticus]|uniref:Uncharacterized protein n=1 Tax=Deinococcus cellulosilyticus (strain DSM 18568 / NBRC 106333 / KACC 11606 / 5516J-15) TaxID=1223518 RepID=A0A511N3J2_DEIC1|nr:hypothetical protein [Deinococcus cellulosilyticus]GEM47018.1 hypothetical protein DC3_26530 [Deinococcus cellulosilyticus NBRC 106333 = KACC 11606]
MYTFREAASQSAEEVGQEGLRLAKHHLKMARGFILSPRYEETFYASNNLPEQLRKLFSGINPKRVDEDALEVACEKAQKLMVESYLLDDPIQRIYLALKNSELTGRPVHVRRPDDLHIEATETTYPGREVLLALKKLWARDWDFEQVLDRLDSKGHIGIDARPAFILEGLKPELDTALSAEWGGKVYTAFGEVVGFLPS